LTGPVEVPPDEGENKDAFAHAVDSDGMGAAGEGTAFLLVDALRGRVGVGDMTGGDDMLRGIRNCRMRRERGTVIIVALQRYGGG
jgi:hypothetical protein